MAKYTPAQIRALPDEVKDRLFDESANERMADEVYPLLVQAQISAINELLLDVMFRAVSPGEFITKVAAVIPDEAKRKEVTAKILGLMFLSLSEYLHADIAGMIRGLGGDVNLYGITVPAQAVVDRIFSRADAGPLDDHLTQRLQTALKTAVLGVRTPAQLQEVLVGGLKTGGVGLSDVAAAGIVEETVKEVTSFSQRKITVVDDAEYARELEAKKVEEAETSSRSAASVSAAPAQAPVPAQAEHRPEPRIEKKSPAETEAFFEADRAAVAAATKIDKPINAVQPTSFEFTLEALVGEALAICGPLCADEEMALRFKILVESYFHDLRDDIDLRGKLELPANKGGLGLAKHETEDIIGRLSHRKRDFQKQLASSSAAQKAKFVEAKVAHIYGDSAAQENDEQGKLDHLYDTLMVRAGVKQPQKSAPPRPVSAEPKIIHVVNQDEDAIVPAVMVPQPRAAAVGSATTVSAAFTPPPKPATLQPSSPMQDAMPPKPITPPPPVPPAPKPAPAPTSKPMSARPPAAPMPTPRPSAAALTPMPAAPSKPTMPMTQSLPASPKPSAQPAARPSMPSPTPRPQPAPQMNPSAKPTMSDVQITRKLTGPVEEIGLMTLGDFRKLSRDPNEATLKIKDKIDLLDDTSYEMKIRGIKAWQGSEPNRLYLDLLRESLDGKPIAQVIADRETAKQPVLAKAEFNAILELNKQLRFG